MPRKKVASTMCTPHYVVNSNETGYETLDLQKQGTADLGTILDQNMIIIPMMQDNKLEAFRIIG
jgi:hypothetical protein